MTELSLQQRQLARMQHREHCQHFRKQQTKTLRLFATWFHVNIHFFIYLSNVLLISISLLRLTIESFDRDYELYEVLIYNKAVKIAMH